jgi:hypothetical protein
LALARRARPLKISFPGSRRVGFSARVLGGRLKIVLSKRVGRIRVAFGDGSIRTTGRLAADVQQRHAPLITIAVVASNRSGYWAYAPGRVRPLT